MTINKEEKRDKKLMKKKRERKKKPKNKPPKTPDPEPKEKAKAPPVAATTDSLEFTFDVSKQTAVPAYLQQRKKKLSRAMMLQAAQENKRKLEASKDTAEGKKLIDEQAWSNMIKKAQGEKVKDDIGKLKKSVKKQEAKKKKSAKEWDSRVGLQKKSMQDAQIKRKTNLQERKQAKKDKKMGVKKKSQGKGRAGFEGKKKNYL